MNYILGNIHSEKEFDTEDVTTTLILFTKKNQKFVLQAVTDVEELAAEGVYVDSENCTDEMIVIYITETDDNNVVREWSFEEVNEKERIKKYALQEFIDFMTQVHKEYYNHINQYEW